MPHRRAYLHVDSDALKESTFALLPSLAAFLAQEIGLELPSTDYDRVEDLEIIANKVTFRASVGVSEDFPSGYIRFSRKDIKFLSLDAGDILEFSHRPNSRSAELSIHKLQDSKDDLNKMPDALMSWSGSSSGAVQVVFEYGSGNPCLKAYETQLIKRIRFLSSQLMSGKVSPKIVMLAGGAGNGKTHAVQHLLEGIAQDREKLAAEFRLRSKKRLVKFNLRGADVALFSSHIQNVAQIWVIQDASESDSSGRSPEDLLNTSIKDAIELEGIMLIVCVNRGVLYGAATKINGAAGYEKVANFLGNVVTCLDPMSIDKDCWPMASNSDCYVWPLDIDSLFENRGKESSVAEQVLHSIHNYKWSLTGEISDECPMLYARNMLAEGHSRKALAGLFHVYEILSGRNMPFRGMLSAFSYLLMMGRKGDEPQPSRLAKIVTGDLLFSDDMRSAWSLYSRSLPFLMFPRLPSTIVLREKISKIKSRDLLNFVLELADEIDRMNSITLTRSLTPGAELFCSPSSVWSDLVDPALCSPDRKVIESAFLGAPASDIDSLVQIEELCHINPARAMSLISVGIDAGSNAVLLKLCECRLKLGELMEKHQLYELHWFSRWISRLFATIAKRSLGIICLARGQLLVNNIRLISEYMSLAESSDPDKVSSISNFIFSGSADEEQDHVIQLGKGLCQPYPEAGSARLKFENGVPEVRMPKKNVGLGMNSTRPRFGGLVIELGEEGSSIKMPVTPSMYFLVTDMMRQKLLAGSVPAAIRGAIDAFRLQYDGAQVHLRDRFKLKLGNLEKNIRINSLAQGNNIVK